MIWTIPNILTMGRMALLPFMIACFYLEADASPEVVWVCFGLYVLAALTDFFDGWAARKFNKISAFGTFLDPISDKIFVGTLLILLTAFGRLEGLWLLPNGHFQPNSKVAIQAKTLKEYCPHPLRRPLLDSNST